MVLMEENLQVKSIPPSIFSCPQMVAGTMVVSTVSGVSVAIGVPLLPIIANTPTHCTSTVGIGTSTATTTTAYMGVRCALYVIG